jgi:hypothetical protein
MRKFLAHDESGELRLVYTDLWNGQHERTEYRVTGGRGGDVLRNHDDLDGREVFGTVPGLYIKGALGAPIAVWTQETAIGPTVKTPCRRLASKSGRAKCTLCEVPS